MLKGLFISRNSATKIPKIQHVPLVFNIQNLSFVVKDNLIAKILTEPPGEKRKVLQQSHPPPDGRKAFQIANNFTIIIAIKLPMAS